MNANENNTSVHNENNTTINIKESIKEALREGQEIVENSREVNGLFNNSVNISDKTISFSPNSPTKETLQPYIQKVQVITDKVDNKLKITEYTLEYINNGDITKVLVKLGEEVIQDFVLKKGLDISKEIALILFRGKIIFGIIIFAGGSVISYYFSENIKELAKKLLINTQDLLNKIANKIKPPVVCPSNSITPNGQCIDHPNDFFQKLINPFSLFTPRPYPSYSKQYKLALAKKKELITKTSIASTTYNFIDEEYLKNIQDLKEQEKIIEQEEQKYQFNLKLYKEDNRIKNEIFNSLFKSLNEKLSFQLKQEKNTFLNSNQSLSIIANKQYLLKTLNLQDINNINIDSKPYLLKALYFCEDYVLYDKDKQALFDENTIKELEFNSSFYTIFISHKNKLNDTYLNARKELYKSIDEFKKLGFKDLEHAYQTYMSSFTINEELNSKDKTINKNENKEINKNLNQKSNIKESINFKELSLNLKQENNTKENTDTIIKNTNFNNETSLKTKQSNTIIDDIKEDFKIVSNNAIINNTNFKGKKIA
ncbi:TPA: hypothetical protein R1728_001457 [Campylobacter lari]|nr:hypothetical protein [Campylobacter lari]